MREIGHIRGMVAQEVFDYQILLDALREYRKPRDRIRRLVLEGEIVRVKKGLYVFGEPFRRQSIVREQLANLIYGPSYVSLETVLSAKGLVPERVESVTSVTTGRSRTFQTPFGMFTYQGLSPARYAVGAVLETQDGVSFLTASPEKALVDKVWTDKRFAGARVGEFGPYLMSDLRIEEEALRSLDRERLAAAGVAFASRKIDNLVRFVERLRGG